MAKEVSPYPLAYMYVFRATNFKWVQNKFDKLQKKHPQKNVYRKLFIYLFIYTCVISFKTSKVTLQNMTLVPIHLSLPSLDSLYVTLYMSLTNRWGTQIVAYSR